MNGSKFNNETFFVSYTQTFISEIEWLVVLKCRATGFNDVDKPVARHFNAANHSISDIKVCVVMIAVKDTKSVLYI